MSAKKPQIYIDFNNNFNGIITIVCPECRRKIKKKLKELSPNKKVVCSCGYFTATFTGDDLRKIQKGFDGIKKGLKSLGG